MWRVISLFLNICPHNQIDTCKNYTILLYESETSTAFKNNKKKTLWFSNYSTMANDPEINSPLSSFLRFLLFFKRTFDLFFFFWSWAAHELLLISGNYLRFLLIIFFNAAFLCNWHIHWLIFFFQLKGMSTTPTPTPRARRTAARILRSSRWRWRFRWATIHHFLPSLSGHGFWEL